MSYFLSQVSHIKLVAGRVIVARLDGQLDFLELVRLSYLLLTSSDIAHISHSLRRTSCVVPNNSNGHLNSASLHSDQFTCVVMDYF